MAKWPGPGLSYLGGHGIKRGNKGNKGCAGLGSWKGKASLKLS